MTRRQVTQSQVTKRPVTEGQVTMRRVGIWIVGAYGNVSICAVAGAAAIRRRLTDTTGLVTELAPLAGLDLAPIASLVFGGHEIREGSLVRSAKEFGDRNGLLTPELRREIAPDLRRADREIRTGVLFNPGASVLAMASEEAKRPVALADAIERVGGDVRGFAARHRLDDVVVVNVASTEPTPGDTPALRSLAGFRKAVAKNRADEIPASVVYAYAAIDAGYPFVDFTPAVAAGSPPIRELARERGIPHMGRDGKTGETLVKTVLAPLFVARNLPVLSWEGFNMLGNRDGEVLRDPGSLASKVRDKDEALRRILGTDATHSRVRIDYVPSLEDWKQAYDFIHFRGFLGARMQMHFLWQGCDSALAAPLVLDLARMAEFAHRRGETGTMPHLAPFFKTPLDVEEQDFGKQMDRLARYAEGARESSATSP
jgi:myo-inositol-1-phosphate synthase